MQAQLLQWKESFAEVKILYHCARQA
uniref:Uncharacterized protein n=1 Tax=Moniliophthora roreri TaxID=221103 RepID=A0A0W0FLU0_MONRR